MKSKKIRAAYSKQRKNIRFTPDSTVVAWIDFGNASAPFKPKASALVFSESYSGCGLVVLTAHLADLESAVRVKIGELAPLVGEIAWVHELDADTCKVGVRYLQ